MQTQTAVIDPTQTDTLAGAPNGRPMRTASPRHTRKAEAIGDRILDVADETVDRGPSSDVFARRAPQGGGE